MKPLYLLTGCTASGKTGLSIAWAERHGAEIVSCDSMLFYRGMDIGTAKPTQAERARVPHHLIDVLEPAERMDVKRYCELAREVVADVEARGRRVLVVGGSGFYLRSFIAPVADDVEVDPELRSQLERDLAAHGLDELVCRLLELNPSGLGSLDTRNPRRVVRALERCLVSGQTLAGLAASFQAAPAAFAGREIRIVEIVREPVDLRRRIAERTRMMIEQGLVDEVRALRAAGFERNAAASSAIGYREVLSWLDHPGGSLAELAASITQSTGRLARKQRTWFRTQLPAHRVVNGDAGPDALFPET